MQKSKAQEAAKELKPDLTTQRDLANPGWQFSGTGELASFPPPEKWDDWVEYDAREWPNKVERHYQLVPTICFNCEAACGLLAYVDKATLEIRKFEGNPAHPGSRGRNCAKGPATLNQVYDPERILYPMKRKGPRGGGQWERTTWDEVLDTFATKIRAAIVEDRKDEVMYHVGRPGSDGYIDRVLQAWGVDGHNSHTNVCSASARLGYALWQGADRPSPDHANARFLLLLSAHLETGHYFNPHAQRIIEAKMRGAKIAVIDTRLSNTASMADYWLSSWPGSEAALLLSIAHVILKEDLYNTEYMRRWVNWEEFLREERPSEPQTFDNFIANLKQIYAEFTPEFAEAESGVAAAKIVEIAREIARAGPAFASHVWRNAASGNLGGWQVARCLEFLNVLTGSIGTVGGVSPNNWNKFVATPFSKPAPQNVWNEVLYPKEWPLAHHEMSFLLPHLVREGRGKIAAYFTRVYNPVWTNPDGASWIEMLSDETKVELHGALTPVWSETAYFADYILPMGVGAERHDLMSQETQSGSWIGFRQPVMRVIREQRGEKFDFTYQANPGEVWEEDEFWIELSWRIDPDGELGIRKYFESPYRPGEKLRIEEYYQWIFENSVPGLPETAAKEGLTPLQYMRKYGSFAVEQSGFAKHEKTLSPKDLSDTSVDPVTSVIQKNGAAVGVQIDGKAVVGFATPSRKLEFYSKTMKDWGWPEYALPGYIHSHVHPKNIDRDKGEYCLLPTFRLPTLIHTRSGNAKWLYEISNRNPVWIHTSDARCLGVVTGDMVRVSTAIGYFIGKVWETEGIHPGVVGCSHHLGRWRLEDTNGVDRWASALVELKNDNGSWRMRQLKGIEPFKSADPESERVWWQDPGVHQNMTFPVQPDPVSGMHCWHQKVTVERARPEDKYGDVFVDTNKAHEVYKEWLKQTRPAPGPNGLRRPLWFSRAVKPSAAAYKIK
ncbi:MAG TPA: molybdopterin-dependent oxidoreductase [Blastocatellia bacterium]|nr:molybdopterin-dependent oxidoreductase [Blastocatellia bacterium]